VAEEEERKEPEEPYLLFGKFFEVGEGEREE